MLKVKLHLLDTGYCTNFEKMIAKNNPMRVKRFYALVGLIEHPTLGPILFDTGYSSHVIQLCKHFPYFLYSLITPIHFTNTQSAAYQIQKFGYKPEDVKHIILSHFHPDHIGGLKDFNQAQIHCSKYAYSKLKKLSFFGALKEVFFKRLLPNDFAQRAHDIQNRSINVSFEPFKEGFDLFGDQSILAVDLPGHALGQFGIFLKTDSQVVFLAADACWQSDNYINLEYPHMLAKTAINDYTAFCTTLCKLQKLKIKNPEIEIVPSHCQKIWEQYVKKGKSC